MNGGELRAVFSRAGVCYSWGVERITGAEWFAAMASIVTVDGRD